VSEVELREMSNQKHERIVLRFESLALHPCLHRNDRISL